MITRLRWIISGALLSAIAITGGSVYMKVRDERAAELVRQREAAIREAEELRAHNAELERERIRLAEETKRLEIERQKLADAVERLNVEHRVAHVDVLQQHVELDGRIRQTVLRLTEIDRNGEPLSPRIIGVPGDMPHFDALVIKFDSEQVARGDALRGKSLALFRRVYGDSQAPEAGYWLSEPGDVPGVYRGGPEPSEFERNLWRDFWTYAREPELAREAGVRVAQGEAVYAPMAPGEHWVLTLEADGGLNLIKTPEARNAQSDFAEPPTMQDGARLRAPAPLKTDTPTHTAAQAGSATADDESDSPNLDGSND